VRNRALDHLKRRRIESRWLEQELIEVEWAHTQRLADRTDGVVIEEWGAAVREALQRLPERRRQAVLLRWRDGLSYEEIARSLHVSVKTVENQIGRGLKTLREALRGSGGAPEGA
jgi:RNA polymerase sigma-70 factor (ECF subfamily)